MPLRKGGKGGKGEKGDEGGERGEGGEGGGLPATDAEASEAWGAPLLAHAPGLHSRLNRAYGVPVGGAAERAGWRRLLPLTAAERSHPVLLVDSAVHGACSVRPLGALLDEAAARRNGSAALAASLRKEERSRRGREGPKGAEDEPRAMPRWGARAHLGKAAGAAGAADAEAVSGDLRAVLADTDAADGGMGDGGGGGGGG